MTGETKMRFTEGHVVRRNFVVIAAELAELVDADVEFTRVFALKDGKWGHFDVENAIDSLHATAAPSVAMYCLVRDGTIFVWRPRSGGGPTREVLPDAGVGPGKLGYMARIRQIGNSLYACGAAGQVYRREASGWVHFDMGILDRLSGASALDLNCLDGTSENDIYVVGQHGFLAHFDGHQWTRLRPPSSLNFYWVRCVSPSEVYVCGQKGGVFRGNHTGWENYSRPDLGVDFWCAETFNGKLYFAATPRLYEFDGERISAVSTGLRPVPDGHRLHANEGVLWSFGNSHLCFFDGTKWTYVKHPDNVS
jgi:hypothetical protein